MPKQQVLVCVCERVSRRVAREASAAGGSGVGKFLDELGVWRELAHAFCAAA
jgi:hypothetical protein